MKLFLLLLFVATVSATPLILNNIPQAYNNALDQLIKEYIEYIRWLLKRHEPFNFPSLPQQQLVDDDINFTFSSTDVKLSKATGFTIDKLSSNLPRLHVTFGATVPTGHLDGNYQVDGKAFKKNVKGSGTFSADISQLVVTGEIQLKIVDHSLQVDTIKADYQLSDAKFDLEGLQIEGRTKEEIEAFLNQNLLKFLDEHKAFVVEKIANHIIEIANKILFGHSLQEVLDWIKNMVKTTPDPPPFPFH